ncbi:MAG: DUF1848 domain-containing protein [Thermoleophilia bacterium]
MTEVARVVSVSRRTDIPAFYTEWFMNRVRAGFCHWMNPFGGQVYRVSLRPEDCLALVFWTRNARPLMRHLDALSAEGHRFYFHYTINGYPREIDTHAPPEPAAVAALRRLAAIVSPELVMWRYDPVVFSSITPGEYHVRRFESLSAQLEGSTRRCYLSFVDPYGKTQRNLARVDRELHLGPRRPDAAEQRELLAQLAPIADARGMTLHACCDDPAPDLGVQKARCIDPDVIRHLGPDVLRKLKAAPSREGCGCVEAVDIGAYDTCTFGCIYCYATNSRKAALARRARHDPTDTILWRPDTMRGVDLTSVEQRPKQAGRPKGGEPASHPTFSEDPPAGGQL